MEDHELIRALIGQVKRAIRSLPFNGDEKDVVTIITRPMYDAYLQAVGGSYSDSPDVYGTRAIVVESKHAASMTCSWGFCGVPF